MKPTTNSQPRTRSSIESFLDEYQLVRLVVNVAALLVVVVFVAIGHSTIGGALPGAVAVTVIIGHASWCRTRHIRAPRTMLLLDITLLGALMFTMPGRGTTLTGMLGFLALIVVLFAEGRWRMGLLAYLSAWYLGASLYGTTGSATTVTDLVGGLFAVVAAVVVMARVRNWLASLDASRSQMIGSVSHELRNNLTAVIGLTQIVSTMEEIELEEARELVGAAHRQAIDASEIVEDLLTESRVGAASLTVTSGPVDVNAEAAVVARRFGQADHPIILTFADDLPAASADPLRVRQVIRNLLSNALRYGGPEVAVVTREVGTNVEIIVRDNGDGVPETDVGTIFLPYRRSTVGPRDPQSVGLGLSICRHLAHAMGGTLEYRRTDGLTEFVLSLERSDSSQVGTVGSRVR